MYVGRAARTVTKAVEQMRFVTSSSVRAAAEEMSLAQTLLSQIQSNGDPILRNLLSQVVNLKTVLETTDLSWVTGMALNRVPLQIRQREHLLRRRLRRLLGRDYNEAFFQELLELAMGPQMANRRGILK